VASRRPCGLRLGELARVRRSHADMCPDGPEAQRRSVLSKSSQLPDVGDLYISRLDRSPVTSLIRKNSWQWHAIRWPCGLRSESSAYEQRQDGQARSSPLARGRADLGPFGVTLRQTRSHPRCCSLSVLGSPLFAGAARRRRRK
jgi:hypothetical protein